MLSLIVVYAVSVVGVYQAYHNFMEYFKSLANIFLFSMLFFAISNCITDQNIIRNAIKTWIVVSLFVALYGFYQFCSYFVPSLPIISETQIIEYGGIPRASSILKEPVPFVLYLIYPIIFLWVMVVEKQLFPFKTLKGNLLALCVLLIAFVLSFSLTGLLYILTVTALYSFLQISSVRLGLKKIYLALLVVCVFATIGFATDFGGSYFSRWISVQAYTDPSAVARMQSVSIAIEEFLKYPVFGIGAGNFPLYTAAGLFPGRVQYEIHYSDTLAAHILAELGIVGFIAVGLFFGSMLLGLRKVIRLNTANDLNVHISRALYLMALTYVVAGLFASGWLEFWAWFIFSIIGTWLLLENRRLKAF